MITADLREFLARSTDVEFDDTALAGVLRQLPALSAEGPWLAGGALRRTLQGKALDSDYDFFFRDADQLASFVQGLEAIGLEKIRETEHHVHYRGQLGKAGQIHDVQCIRFAFYPDASSVIASFDFTICMFAFDGRQITYGDYALWDLGRRRLAVNKITYPVATMRRLLKYASQGFTACKGALSAILTETADDPALRSQLSIQYVD